MNTTFFKYICICSLLFTLLSCEKDNELEKKLIGKWVVESVNSIRTGVPLPFQKGDILILNNNSKFEISQKGKGTWMISNKNLELLFDNSTNKFTAIAVKSGSKLELHKMMKTPAPNSSIPNGYNETKIFSIELRKIE